MSGSTSPQPVAPPDADAPLGRLLAAVSAALPELGARFVAQHGRPPQLPRWAPDPAESRQDWLAAMATARADSDRMMALALPAVDALAVESIGPQEAGGWVPAVPADRPTQSTSETRIVSAASGDVSVLVHRPVLPEADQDGGSATALPTVLFVHGGGFWAGAAVLQELITTPLLSALARWLPAVVIDIDVRLMPEHPFPAPVEDVAAVLAAVRADPTSWGIDPARIALAGQSSGANAVVAAALQDAVALRGAAEGSHPPIRALGLWVPSLDLTHYGSSFATPEARAERDRQVRAYAGTADLRDPLVSPVFGDLGVLPPAVVDIAEHDDVVTGGALLFQRQRAAGLPSSITSHPGLHAIAAPSELRRGTAFVFDGLRTLLQ